MNPDVTVEQGGSQNDPTNTSPVVFDVDFDEDVTGLTGDDVITAGSTATMGGSTIGNAGDSDDSTYTISIPVTGDGTVTASLGIDAAQDAADNGNSASTSTDNTVTVDTADPTTTITFPADGASYNEAADWNAGCEPDGLCGTGDGTGSDVTTVSWSLQIDGGNYWDGTGFDSPDEDSHAATGTTSWNQAFAYGTLEEETYVLRVRANDSAGNTEDTSMSTFTIDETAPDVEISLAAGQADPATSSPVEFDADFTEDVIDFDDPGDVIVTGTATTGTPTLTEVASDAYEISIPVTSDGTVIVDIPADSATDAAGNGNTDSTGVNTVTVDLPEGGDGGGDQVLGQVSLPGCPTATISGTGTLTGTSGNDVIIAATGNNVINGLGGNDVICTGPGNDTIVTGNGKDKVISGDGDDTVKSKGGNDKINTGDGNDIVKASSGNDKIKTGSGNDKVNGGSGTDKCNAGSGTNKVVKCE